MKAIKDLVLQLKKLNKPKPDLQAVLFPPALEWASLNVEKCPKCLRKLYWNRTRTIIRCKSKLHKFVLTKKSFDDIVSGKRLGEWIENDEMLRR